MGNTLDYLLKLQDQFSGPLKQARDEQGRFTAGTKQLGAGASSVNKLGGSFAGLATKLGAALGALSFGMAAFTGFKKAISGAADMESTEIAFTNLIGNAAKAKETLQGLFAFAASTPFEMPEVQASAVKLMAAGVAADDLNGSLMVLGNVTSAYQADLSSISTIFSQVVNKGKLYAEEIQQFGENGVPALQLLAQATGKSTAEIMRMGSAGELTASDLAAAFNKAGGTGGKFANAMVQQAATMGGLWSTLKDNVNMLFVALGQPINDSLKPWLQKAISAVGTVTTVISQAVAQGKIGESIYHAFQLGRKMGFNAIVEGFRQLPALVMGSLDVLSRMIGAALTGDIDMVKSIYKSVMDGSFKIDTSEHTKFFSDLIAGATQVKDAASEAKISLQEVAAEADKADKAGKKKEKSKKENKSDEPRKIYGFSYAKSGANAGFSGLAEYDRLQERAETDMRGPARPGYSRGGYLPVNTAFKSGAFKMPTPISSADKTPEDGAAPEPMKRRMMGSSLDTFHARNGTKGYKPAFVPQIPSPGTARRSQERREAAATASRQSGGSHPLMATIKEMQAKLNSLALAR
jgi:tape measure domain-containing protein